MFEVGVYNDRQHKQFLNSSGRFALRQNAETETEWQFVDNHDRAGSTDTIHFAVTEAGLTVDSTGLNISLLHGDGSEVSPTDVIHLPCVLRVGSTWLEVRPQIAPRSLVPLLSTELIDFSESQTQGDGRWSGPSSETITRWLAEASTLHCAAANSPEFYADAARFAVETVGLDAAWVITPSHNEWHIVGSNIPAPEFGVCFDTTAIEQLQRQLVAWYEPTPSGTKSDCCISSPAIVMAPVLDATGDLVAAIYGIRNTFNGNRRHGIRPLEARLVQLLAESVGVGIARLQQETEAARTQVLLEQAFSPTVAAHIRQHPACLSGQQREISLLFADLRGYTSIAESLLPEDCYTLVGDVMESLTQIVMQHRGIVVDYYGDGLLAIWNAPLEQVDHADLACTAALEMFDALLALADQWNNRLKNPLEMGIGIHSGQCYVGNAGAHSRIKYGPRGNTVNVANRVQSAAKQLQLPLVITSTTKKKLSDKFFTLRICTAQLPGLQQPVELYTVYPATEASRVKTRLDQYARALELFETGDLQQAEELLAELVTLGQATPARFLAHYTALQANDSHLLREADKRFAACNPVIEIVED